MNEPLENDLCEVDKWKTDHYSTVAQHAPLILKRLTAK